MNANALTNGAGNCGPQSLAIVNEYIRPTT